MDNWFKPQLRSRSGWISKILTFLLLHPGCYSKVWNIYKNWTMNIVDPGLHKLSVAWSLPTESLVRMPKSTNSSHIPYQWDNCNTKRSRSPWNTNNLKVLSNRIWCFFAQSIWTLEFLLTFLTLSFYTSRRHNDTQQTCFVKCKDIFSDKDFFSLLCFFCCLILCPSEGLGRKKVQLSVLCPCLPPSLLLADNTWQQIFWTLSHFEKT